MEIKIQNANKEDLGIYKKILDEYNATYKEEDGEHFAIIEITDLKQLLTLPKELETDITLSVMKTITIYDGYMD